MLLQLLLQQIEIDIPLAIGTAYQFYNKKGNKGLIVLHNKLGQGIS
jgi:hypothetical protein